MLRQLLLTVKDDESMSDIENKHNLLSIEHLILSSSLHACDDMDHILDDIFRPAKDAYTRALHYKCMTVVAQLKKLSATASRRIEQGFATVIGNFANFISAVSREDESNALIDVLTALLNIDSDKYKAHFEQSIPGIVQSAIGLLDDVQSARFGLLILNSLLHSVHRSICQNYFASIRNTSMKWLNSSTMCDIAAEVIAVSLISETADNWMTQWRNYSFSIVATLQSIGLASQVGLASGYQLMSEFNLDKLSGITKAITGQNFVIGYITVLQKVFHPYTIFICIYELYCM